MKELESIVTCRRRPVSHGLATAEHSSALARSLLLLCCYEPVNETHSLAHLIRGVDGNAGVHKAARSKTGVWKIQEWTYRHGMARVDIAGMGHL